MKIITFVIIWGILMCLICATIVFMAPEGISFLHEHTDIVCNIKYNDDLDIWRFSGNSTEITAFIEECKRRGIGN